MKKINVICLRTTGEVELESVELEMNNWYRLELKPPDPTHFRSSMGPLTSVDGFTFVATWFEGEINPYHCIVDEHCRCGYHSRENKSGDIYIEKHDPRLWSKCPADFFEKSPTYEDAEKYSTTVNATDEDLKFICSWVAKEMEACRIQNMTWAQWCLYKLGLGM